MKEGAIIHRYGANSVLRNMMTVTTNDGTFGFASKSQGSALRRSGYLLWG